MKNLIGGLAPDSPAQLATWAADLIPRSENQCARSTRSESLAASSAAWGQGNADQAKREMREAGRTPGSRAQIPWAKLAPLSAPGPSGDRQEYLDDMLNGCGARSRRRLIRARDSLTVCWATNNLLECCAWMHNTQVIFLKKDRASQSKHFEDDEWARWASTSFERDGDEESVAPYDSDVAAEDVDMIGPELPPGVSVESMCREPESVRDANIPQSASELRALIMLLQCQTSRMPTPTSRQQKFARFKSANSCEDGSAKECCG